MFYRSLTHTWGKTSARFISVFFAFSAFTILFSSVAFRISWNETKNSSAFISSILVKLIIPNETFKVIVLPLQNIDLKTKQIKNDLKMTLTFGTNCYCFYCDFTGKPSSSSGCYDSESGSGSSRFNFEDDQMVTAYRVPSHYLNSDPTLSPDTVIIYSEILRIGLS